MSESRVPQNPIVIIIFPIETAKCWGFPIFFGHRTPIFNMCIPELSITIHWNPSNMLINYIILYDNSLHPHYISIVSLRWLVLSSLLVDSPLNHHEHIWFVSIYTHYITITSPIIEIVNWLHWIITISWFVTIRSPLYHRCFQNPRVFSARNEADAISIQKIYKMIEDRHQVSKKHWHFQFFRHFFPLKFWKNLG